MKKKPAQIDIDIIELIKVVLEARKLGKLNDLEVNSALNLIFSAEFTKESADFIRQKCEQGTISANTNRFVLQVNQKSHHYM